MAFKFVETVDAIAMSGIRMTVVGGVPSPWSEAAKAIFHIKGLDWAAVRLEPENDIQTHWTGRQSAPAAILNDGNPLSSWIDILFLGEQLAPEPSLLPVGPFDRALTIGLSHEFLGENGLARARRLQLVHAGLEGKEGFTEPVANYLAAKYGYTPQHGAAAELRVRNLLKMYAKRLRSQHEAGSQFYIGDSLTYVDICSAVTTALFQPLPERDCAMRRSTGAAFETTDNTTRTLLDPIVLEHRDLIYRRFLELPVIL
ncbi:hypothetical protein [uncultured Roseobacter sp.]|uniref:hypothetical protein n=1 Tax=uncultured Roseobacter sp. TaxID=114847 RepID=UPI00261A8090|nr:hypothetical protein [uncultured Roseobacter sp.]